MTTDPEIPLLSSVPERLNLLAELYKQRQQLYGDNYKLIGDAFVALFPNGLTLNSPEGFNRFSLFVQILTKMTRYGQMFAKGGHTDSLNDMAVYAQMLQELDDRDLMKDGKVESDKEYNDFMMKLKFGGAKLQEKFASELLEKIKKDKAELNEPRK